MNSGTPSVRSTICCTIPGGNALPPVTPRAVGIKSEQRDPWSGYSRQRELRPEPEDHQDPQRRHEVDEQITQLTGGGIAPMKDGELPALQAEASLIGRGEIPRHVEFARLTQ